MAKGIEPMPTGLRSSGMVVVRRSEGRFLYLVLRAYRHWDFPKGRIEPGEDPLECARREVAEETGLCELHFPWGMDFYETEPYGRGKISRYYLTEAPEGKVVLGVNPELGRPEHHEHRWLPYSAARRLLVPRVQGVLDWAESVRDDGAQ